MDEVKQKAFSQAHDFFSDELRTLLDKHQVSAQEGSFNYLVDLLCRNIHSEQFFSKKEDGRLEDHFLVELYAEYIRSDVHRKKVILQRLGDICLLVSGYFAQSLQKKVVDLGYYFGMGGTAYQKLSELQGETTTREVYAELSFKFKPYSNVLNEMSERSGINSNKDLLRLYERWLSTGSDRIKTVLQEHGIQGPIPLDLKIKH